MQQIKGLYPCRDAKTSRMSMSASKIGKVLKDYLLWYLLLLSVK